MTGYAGYTESEEKVQARKARILQVPNLAVDDIPPFGECSPMYYEAMTPEQRAEYDKQAAAFYAERDAPVVLDRLGMALAIKRQFQGVM